jgi:hypothetical protein
MKTTPVKPVPLLLTATNWDDLAREVRLRLTEHWHAHAGRWSPHSVVLNISHALLPQPLADAGVQQTLQALKAWLGLQTKVLTVRRVGRIRQHELFLYGTTEN